MTPAGTPPTVRGARVVVLGLGRFGGGLGVARWLLREGADVCVTDRASRVSLAGPAQELEDLGARLVLGGHDGVDLGAADLLVVNPAVPLDAPLVCEARERDVSMTCEIALLMERWPGPLVGVTGSNGKSTTVGLTQAVLEAAGRHAVVGGNLGGSLLDRVDAVPTDTAAVLELSSFMLEMLGSQGFAGSAGRRLDVAVITNLTPNHLDRHGSFEAYARAKAVILQDVRAAVLPTDSPELAALARGREDIVRWFGPDVAETSSQERPHLAVSTAGDLVDRSGALLLASERIPLPGRMNRLDLAAATLAAGALVDDPGRCLAALPAALAAYRAPPHRLQEVASRAGVRWVDDSVSTTPESTAASLEAVEGPCILIAGGHDKGLDPAPLLAAARARGCKVLTVGEEGPHLAEALNRCGVHAEQLGTVEAAVERAASLAREGDTVLLSPGYSSHDQFVHFEERARAFRAAVAGLAGPEALSWPSAEC